jgi:CcmD family protein
MRKTLLSLLTGILTLLPMGIQAQGADADFLRSTGKIYVVVAVIAAIFIGIVLFLIYLDRKLTNLENQIQENDN